MLRREQSCCVVSVVIHEQRALSFDKHGRERGLECACECGRCRVRVRVSVSVSVNVVESSHEHGRECMRMHESECCLS